MGRNRTIWHVLFAALLEERAPPGIVVTSEVVLSNEPQRADLLVVRRGEVARRDGEARVMRGLWPHLSRETLVEFKSAGRPARRGDWFRLLGYAAQYGSEHIRRLQRASELTMLLVVPALTPTVAQEGAALGWALDELGSGLYRARGPVIFPAYVVALDEMAEAERDDLLGWFAGGKLTQLPADTRWWIMAHTTTPRDDELLTELDGYDEMMQSLLESLAPETRRAVLARLKPEDRLAGLAPEERVAGLAPEERLAGLAPEETLEALPVEVLRHLSDEYIASLPEPVRARIRSRLGD